MAIALLLTGWGQCVESDGGAFPGTRGKEFGVRKSLRCLPPADAVAKGLTEAGIVNLLATLIALGWLEVLLPLYLGGT